jgi:RNA recognition motif-containing protein
MMVDALPFFLLWRIELKASLYNLFASYGHIVDVKAQSTEKLREQAFVAFVDVTSATTAMRSLEGFVFYDKPLVSVRKRSLVCF